MSDFDRRFARPTAVPADMAVDAGLRAFMLGVYNKLALGLVLSAALAYLFSHQLAGLFYTTDGARFGLTPLGMIVRLAPLGIIFGAMFFMRNPTPRGAALYYCRLCRCWAPACRFGLRSTPWAPSRRCS